MNRIIQGIPHTNVLAWLIIGAIVCLLQGCTDHKTTVPFSFPEYVPQLVVQSAVGPHSGAEATIAWSRPLRGQPGEIPDLPDLSVFLLQDGERVNTFLEAPDSTGYFTIAPDLLTLQQDVPYAIELLFEDTEESLFSDVAYLPPEPIMESVVASVPPERPGWYDLSLTGIAAAEGVGAVALVPLLFDDHGSLMGKAGLDTYFRAAEFRYVDDGSVPERTIQRQYNRMIGGDHEHPVFANAVAVWLAYLSPELAHFKRDVDGLGYRGESYFQTVRPVYSNMNGAIGVFGMYNEVHVVLPIVEEDTP